MDEKIKVTDKRMFTADGELREGHQEPPPDRDADERREPRPAETPATTESSGVELGSASAAPGESPSPPEARAEKPLGARDSDFPAPTFVDLIGMLAQPIAMFLGDAAVPGRAAEEDLPLARFHIDLLELVQSKTKGNITSEEEELLEDLLYKLRMRYVEKAG